MAISWRARRQLLFFAIFAGMLGLVLWALFSWIVPAPTCTDKRQNQGEEDVDCGGPCERCIKDAKDPVIMWVRFFEVSPGHFEVVALVENVNSNFGAKNTSYRFRFYDSKNILIAARDGKTFLNPSERFVIFNPDIPVFERVPVRATLEFSPIEWVLPARERPQILVTRKEFQNDPAGKVRVQFSNEGLFPVLRLGVASVLLDANGNAIGVSISEIARLEGEESREVFFTWRTPFNPPPETIEVLWRVNLLE